MYWNHNYLLLMYNNFHMNLKPNHYYIMYLMLQYYLYYFTSHSEPNTTNHLGAGCGTSKCSFDSADKGTAHAVDTQIKLNKVLHVIVNSIV